MINPYPAYDHLLQRAYSPAERLGPAMAALCHARRLLEQTENTMYHASDTLSDEDLSTICRAAEMAYNACSNVCHLGTTGYHPLPVEAVRWIDYEEA